MFNRIICTLTFSVAIMDFNLVPSKWETVMIERRDTGVLVQFANGPVFHGVHPSYASELHKVMLGGLEAGVMEIDNITLWAVKDGVQPEWEAFRAKLPPQQNIVLRCNRFLDQFCLDVLGRM
jgi:hypothetical protein